MNNVIEPPTRPASNIAWQTPRRAHSDHPFEVIAHEMGAALKRCPKCRNREAE